MPPLPAGPSPAGGASAAALLAMAAGRVDEAAAACVGLVPEQWHSPAATQYRLRVSALEGSARRAATALLVAADAAQVHERAISQARVMLAGGGARPV